MPARGLLSLWLRVGRRMRLRVLTMGHSSDKTRTGMKRQAGCCLPKDRGFETHRSLTLTCLSWHQGDPHSMRSPLSRPLARVRRQRWNISTHTVNLQMTCYLVFCFACLYMLFCESCYFRCLALHYQFYPVKTGEQLNKPLLNNHDVPWKCLKCDIVVTTQCIQHCFSTMCGCNLHLILVVMLNIRHRLQTKSEGRKTRLSTQSGDQLCESHVHKLSGNDTEICGL